MSRLLLVCWMSILATSSMLAQGFTRPPGTPIPNTVVIVQPVRVLPYAPYNWSRGPLIGTGLYANRPWIATPWMIQPGTNLTVTPPAITAPPVAEPKLESAILNIDFPFNGTEVTVNGQKEPGTMASFSTKTPPLSAGQVHTFQVKARWTSDGKAYEWEKTYKLTAGEKVRSIILNGSLVAAAVPTKK